MTHKRRDYLNHPSHLRGDLRADPLYWDWIINRKQKVTLIETYYPKLIYEIGLLGCLAFLGMLTTLMFVTFKEVRSLQDKRLRGYGIGLWLFLLLISYNLYSYPLDVDTVAVYYWFLAGMLLKLPALEQNNF